MTLRTWARRLFARPATLPTREAPAGRCPTVESPEDRAPPTISFNPAGGKAKLHRGFFALRAHALGTLVHAGRFRPATIGFWFGAAGMGAGGCFLGALMPYRHPVAVGISVMWWGIYFGVFGASVGALVGFLTERATPRPSAAWERTKEAATELELDSFEAPAASTALCAGQFNALRQADSIG
jgi:hypothetical protein